MIEVKVSCMACRLPVRLELSAEDLETADRVAKGLNVRCSVCNGGKLLISLPRLEWVQSVLKPSGQPGQ